MEVLRMEADLNAVAGVARPAGYDEWLAAMTGDSEFDPAACILAWDGAALVGAVLCWSSAFLKDLCVEESYRRRGLGVVERLQVPAKL